PIHSSPLSIFVPTFCRIIPPPPPRTTLFPYTTLFRSMYNSSGVTTASTIKTATYINAKPVYFPQMDKRFDNDNRGGNSWGTLSIDRKSTRLNSSHVKISYAVFCLKKKKNR